MTGGRHYRRHVARNLSAAGGPVGRADSLSNGSQEVNWMGYGHASITMPEIVRLAVEALIVSTPGCRKTLDPRQESSAFESASTCKQSAPRNRFVAEALHLMALGGCWCWYWCYWCWCLIFVFPSASLANSPFVQETGYIYQPLKFWFLRSIFIFCHRHCLSSHLFFRQMAFSSALLTMRLLAFYICSNLEFDLMIIIGGLRWGRGS